MANDFDLRVEAMVDGVARVFVCGEIDMAVVDQLNACVRDALRADGVRQIEIDLSGLRFIDACGVGGLLMARKDTEERGKTFLLRGAAGLPLRVLEITGVLGALGGKSISQNGAGNDYPA
jgi:anti-sigma B factor antagonist